MGVHSECGANSGPLFTLGCVIPALRLCSCHVRHGPGGTGSPGGWSPVTSWGQVLRGKSCVHFFLFQLPLLEVCVEGSCVEGRPSTRRTELVGPRLIFPGNSGLEVLRPCAPWTPVDPGFFFFFLQKGLFILFYIFSCGGSLSQHTGFLQFRWAGAAL